MEGRRAENGLDRTVTARSDNPDVFDDEYEVETPTSADFHPGDGILTGASGGPDRSSRNLSIPRNNSLDAKATSLPSRNSIRNSIRKSRSAFEGAGAVNDRSTTPVSGTNAQLGDLPQRSSSRASSTFATTERASSPQQQAGPSFPYSLYQQTSAGMGRSPSLATTNAARTSIASSVPQIPAHPYGLYSQNGLDEGGEVSSAQQSIPLGFPGRGDGFHRQVGPDGEEQDIVGPDGHTEQLPPYSRYPEEGAAKVAAVPTVSQPVSPRSVESSTPPQLPSANASRALILDPGSSEASEEISEKSWKEKTWTERRRARVCGGRLPCWMLVFIVVSSIIIAGLVAGLVGGLLSAERKNQYVK